MLAVFYSNEHIHMRNLTINACPSEGNCQIKQLFSIVIERNISNISATVFDTECILNVTFKHFNM